MASVWKIDPSTDRHQSMCYRRAVNEIESEAQRATARNLIHIYNTQKKQQVQDNKANGRISDMCCWSSIASNAGMLYTQTYYTKPALTHHHTGEGLLKWISFI